MLFANDMDKPRVLACPKCEAAIGFVDFGKLLESGVEPMFECNRCLTRFDIAKEKDVVD